ncbi:Cysteine-rich receptor-like protein kinase 2, partial [Linum perenne]
MSLLVIISIGYMALKYLAYGQLTEKEDVYSFRVLLLEIKLVELPMDMMSKRILVKNLYLTQLSCNLNQLLYVVHVLLQAICISE